MSNIVRENEIRALERMNSTLILAKTVFPNDRELMTLWFGLVEGMKECIDRQQKSIDKREE